MDDDKKYQRFLRRIAGNLQRIRKAKGLTQEGMADLGFNYRFYQKLESGTYSPSLRTLYRLSQTLKVEVTELIQ